MSVSVPPDRFEELVADALDGIPEEFAAAMENVAVIVTDRNPDEPWLLGLYHGVALPQRSADFSGMLPDRIEIYREPILEISHSEDEVVRQVAITVVHEIGHLFGIDEDRLHELGWG